MDKVYPIFFQILKAVGVKNPTEGKNQQININKIPIFILDLFTPFVIFIGIGYFLGFISSYMILKINELELKNKIIEKHILDKRNNIQNNKMIPNKKEEIIEQKNEIEEDQKIEEKEPLKEENNEEEKIENNINNAEEIKEEKKSEKPAFVPHKIKERKVEEESWTTIKRGKKSRKPQ